MPEDFFSNTDAIKKSILAYLDKQKSFADISLYGKELIDRLKNFVPKGKLLRSNLCLKTAELLGHEDTSQLIPVAASIEFCHSSLLIHDDIIDQDTLRRGGFSIPEQYRQQDPDQPKLLSQSLAICAGDIGFFFAFDLIQQAEIPAAIESKLSAFIAKEMAIVGQAEMMDTGLGYASDHPSLEDIIKVYRYKTARYTFSLPMMAGAIATEAKPETIASLEKIGESLGILFQIKDDEIGLLGDEKTIGKPVGSDISANKKTIFSYFLFTKASKQDAIKLATIFGKQDLTDKEIEYVRLCLKTYDVLTDVQDIIHTHADDARKEIDTIPSAKMKELLHWFVNYNLSRNY